MQIKVGGKYYARNGEIITIEAETDDHQYPFRNDDHLSYTSDGRYFNDAGCEDESDLVSEVDEKVEVAAEAPPKNRAITISLFEYKELDDPSQQKAIEWFTDYYNINIDNDNSGAPNFADIIIIALESLYLKDGTPILQTEAILNNKEEM